MNLNTEDITEMCNVHLLDALREIQMKNSSKSN